MLTLKQPNESVDLSGPSAHSLSTSQSYFNILYTSSPADSDAHPAALKSTNANDEVVRISYLRFTK